MTSSNDTSGITLIGLGVSVGVLSGLFGVGGGIVLVPMLVILLHYSQKPAQATSLIAIGFTAITGMIAYAMADEVLFRAAGIIAAGGIVGAFLGSGLLRRISDRYLPGIFAILMLVVAIRLLWPAANISVDTDVAISWYSVLSYALIGLAMGIFSALLGVGGGIILVPALVLLVGLSPYEAQGTSLAVIIPVSFTGAWRNSRHGFADWRAGLWLGLGGIVGAPLGSQLALLLPEVWLQRLFAVLLVFSAYRLITSSRRARSKG